MFPSLTCIRERGKMKKAHWRKICEKEKKEKIKTEKKIKKISKKIKEKIKDKGQII